MDSTYSVNVNANGSLDHGVNGKSDINVSLDIKTSRDSSLDLSSDVEIDAEVGVLEGKKKANVSHNHITTTKTLVFGSIQFPLFFSGNTYNINVGSQINNGIHSGIDIEVDTQVQTKAQIQTEVDVKTNTIILLGRYGHRLDVRTRLVGVDQRGLIDRDVLCWRSAVARRSGDCESCESSGEEWVLHLVRLFCFFVLLEGEKSRRDTPVNDWGEV